VTGISLDGTEYVGKWLELLLKINPALSRVGYLYDPDNPGHVAGLVSFSALAAARGLKSCRPGPAPRQILTVRSRK
jgi:hypothetical protein